MTNDEARIVRAGLALDDKDDEVRTTNHSGIVFHTVAERLWIRKEVAFACGSAERRLPVRFGEDALVGRDSVEPRRQAAPRSTPVGIEPGGELSQLRLV